MNEPSVVAKIIEDYRKAEGTSVRSAAKKAGISEGRWRQIAKGYQQATKEVRVPVNAPVETLVKMALALHMNTYNFEIYRNQHKSDPVITEFLDALITAIPKPVGSPMFGGSYEDPEYLGNIEEWVSGLQSRIEMLEDRLAKVEPDIEDDDPDYSNMSEQDAKDYGLAAKEADVSIGHDELPHEP